MTMPPKNVDHSISFLTGEVHALLLAVQALAKAHPNPRGVTVEIHTAEQVGLAGIEVLAVRNADAVIEGYQFAFGELRKYLPPS